MHYIKKFSKYYDYVTPSGFRLPYDGAFLCCTMGTLQEQIYYAGGLNKYRTRELYKPAKKDVKATVHGPNELLDEMAKSAKDLYGIALEEQILKAKPIIDQIFGAGGASGKIGTVTSHTGGGGSGGGGGSTIHLYKFFKDYGIKVSQSPVTKALLFSKDGYIVEVNAIMLAQKTTMEIRDSVLNEFKKAGVL